MPDKEKSATPPVATDVATDFEKVHIPAPAPKFDQRVDEYAAEVFEVLGYNKTDLPPQLIELYKKMKLYKDRLAPSRLTIGEFATITLLASLYEAGPKGE